MTVNTRIVPTSFDGPAALVSPGVPGTPSVQAACLVDGSGNILKATDNGDGTATLATSAVSAASTTSSTSFTVSAVISASAKDYRGFTVRETAGAAAVVRIWDNATTSSGTVLDEIGLAANESARECYPGNGLKALNGIYLQVVSGTVVGSVRTA